MPRRENLLDRAWAEVFEEYNLEQAIQEDGYADVTADQLRRFREPRLMTKMDHSESVPRVFHDNGLNILTRGMNTFRVGPFEVFAELPTWTPPSGDVENLTLPEHIETLDVTAVTGEPAVINAAQAAGIMRHFCGEGTDARLGDRFSHAATAVLVLIMVSNSMGVKRPNAA